MQRTLLTAATLMSVPVAWTALAALEAPSCRAVSDARMSALRGGACYMGVFIDCESDIVDEPCSSGTCDEWLECDKVVGQIPNPDGYFQCDDVTPDFGMDGCPFTEIVECSSLVSCAATCQMVGGTLTCVQNQVIRTDWATRNDHELTGTVCPEYGGG